MNTVKTTQEEVTRYIVELIRDSEHENLQEIIDDLPGEFCIKTISGQSFVLIVSEL